ERDVGLSQLFYELSPEMKARYASLDGVVKSIRANYKRLTATSQMFVDQMESKLDGLSQSYIRLLNSAFHHRDYLRVTSPDRIRGELAQLEKEMEHDPARVQE